MASRGEAVPRRGGTAPVCGVTFLIALLLISAITVPTTTAAAQDQATATDLPALLIQAADGIPSSTFYATIEPGERGQVTINVAVDAASPVDATLAIANAIAPPNGGFGLGPTDGPLAEPAAWLDLDTSSLTLETGEIAALTVNVTVPANTEPGQYVAALTLAATEPVPIPNANGVGQLAQTSAAIAITVPGAFETGFDLGDPTFVGAATGGRIQIPVDNTGTVPVHPQGTLTLEAPDGQEIAAIPVTMGSVFAGTATILDLALPEWPPAGDYQLALDLTDPDTRASADITGAALTIPEPPPGARDPEPFEGAPEGLDALSFDQVAINFEGDPLQSVTVDIDVANVGNPIPATTLTLEITRNGQLVDEVAIAENVALADGVTSFSTTYTPEGGFGSGLVSFRVRLDSIAPDGTATLLVQSGTVGRIDVP